MQAIKILMSAYACEPGKGSEPGVGWRWAIEAAALNHEVWVITRTNNQSAIVTGVAQYGKPKNLHFVYYDLPTWASWWKRGRQGIHLYYVLWQLGAYRCARKLHAAQKFDAVHHITFGVTRHPSFMGRLGIPFIVGPLGGGERAPLILRKYYSLSSKFSDALRDLINVVSKYDPWLRQMYTQASHIYLKTPQSLDWLPQIYQHKASCMLEIGIDQRNITITEKSALTNRQQSLHVVYVGRFIDIKGMDLGLRAIAKMRANGIPVRITMIGQGPAQKDWQQLIARFKLVDAITWIPWMKQQDLLAAYQTFDLLLFPSMHDSSGNVVLEAMASGLPVVCLDLGGPAQIVNQSCGRVVLVAGLDADQVIDGLAIALTEIAKSPSIANALRTGALKRASEFSWKNVVGQVWGQHGNGYQMAIKSSTQDSDYVSA
ncbi:glycosyltransferase family 4 protein [Methylotenera sp.]|uniref:glycosyltransferase family 4 protein n=1 Tax=Methylotenera sp. TaxID=2051956 RepID=UPI002ED8BE39